MRGSQIIGEALSVLIFLPVLVLGGTAYALFHATVETLRWWAGIATVLVPVAGGIGWWLGSREARLQVRGIEMGVGEVAHAAARVAAAVHQSPTVQEMPAVQEPYVLPAIVAVPHQEGEVLL